MKKQLIVLLLLAFVQIAKSQQIVVQVYASVNAKKVPVYGARLLNKQNIPVAQTDSLGKAILTDTALLNTTVYLRVRDFENDSLLLNKGITTYNVLLTPTTELGQVDIIVRNYDYEISLSKTIKVEEIGTGELKKAACCNLAESFESNASVDVVYTDAVSGARTIQMLGLSGLYAPIQIENIPYTRGLAANYGMSFIPGTWLNGIQITKGTGSVVNGFESMSGIINIELLKPENSKTEDVFVNLYGSSMGRAEANVHFNKKFQNKWSTLLFLHGNSNFMENDQNNDRFRDNPLSNQLNVMNRWKHEGKKTEQVIMVQSLVDDKTGGQLGAKAFSNEAGLYGVGIKTQMHQVSVKNGFLFPKKKMASLGLIGNYKYHNHQSNFGLRTFDATQQSVYFNSIYNNYIGNTFHTFKTGASLIYDHTQMKTNGTDTTVTELVPGAYFEYSYSPSQVFNVLIGQRADYHNTFGWQYTPRIHMRYLINEKISIRALAGTGFRTSRTLMENISALASSRVLFESKKLRPEKSFNTGISYSQEFTVNKNKWMFNADYYYTQFINQVVVDYDLHPQELHFYNLNGESFAHSVQAELDMLIARGLQARIAFKRNIVKQTTNNVLQEKVFVSPYRAMFNLSYQTTNKKWKFDWINNWVASARLPHTDLNPQQYSFDERGKDLYILHLQVTKLFRKFETYLGVENLLNQTQKNAVLAADDPFGRYFDAGMIWGPLNGRVIYAGLRYSFRK